MAVNPSILSPLCFILKKRDRTIKFCPQFAKLRLYWICLTDGNGWDKICLGKSYILFEKIMLEFCNLKNI